MKSVLDINNPLLDAEATRKEVARQKIWRHPIPVGHGIVTPGREDNWKDLEMLQFANATGERVLDVGASDGFFSFYHEATGATEVVALDNFKSTPFCGDDTGIVVASKLRQSSVKLLNKSLYLLDPECDGLFDRVLFLNVLYHLKHPIYGLERIASICKPGATLYVKSFISEPKHRRFNLGKEEEVPLCTFYPGRELNNDPSNWFGPNIPCIKAWLEVAGFSDVILLGKKSSRAYLKAMKA